MKRTMATMETESPCGFTLYLPASASLQISLPLFPNPHIFLKPPSSVSLPFDFSRNLNPSTQILNTYCCSHFSSSGSVDPPQHGAMGSATSGESPATVSQKCTPSNPLDDWEVDVSCIPGRKARRERLFALVEHTHLMHVKIYRALRYESIQPSLSSDTYCLSVIKIYNELQHLRNVKET